MAKKGKLWVEIKTV